jgi:hypothetical protein
MGYSWQNEPVVTFIRNCLVTNSRNPLKYKCLNTNDILSNNKQDSFQSMECGQPVSPGSGTSKWTGMGAEAVHLVVSSSSYQSLDSHGLLFLHFSDCLHFFLLIDLLSLANST